jgi:hypothetical protein
MKHISDDTVIEIRVPKALYESIKKELEKKKGITEKKKDKKDGVVFTGEYTIKYSKESGRYTVSFGEYEVPISIMLDKQGLLAANTGGTAHDFLYRIFKDAASKSDYYKK